MGINGKFRHFGSQPQSLEPPQITERHHKFPITNGSLYTSIDGRVPVIHNYRRQYKDRTTKLNNIEPHLSLSMGIHATHLRRQQQQQHTCFCQQKSFSHHNLLNPGNNNELRQHQSKSVDDVIKNHFIHQEPYQINSNTKLQIMNEDDSSAGSDEDYNNHTLSSESCCSITTDANCDFEFFQAAKKPPSIRRASDFRITRSNSRRSLENFQAYVDEATGKMDVKCRKKGKSVENLIEQQQQQEESGMMAGSAFYGGSAPDFRKIFISEYI